MVQSHTRQASRPSVERWIDFFEAPSARSWYLAHNTSIVAGYLAHRDLAALETPAERFFMNVVLVRVLYAHALVSDSGLALGRLAFLGRLLGHPRVRAPEVFLAMKDILPVSYPIAATDIAQLIEGENRLGRVLDYTVIGTRIGALYAFAAQALNEPRILGLVRDEAPVYAWPYEKRQVWALAAPRRPNSSFVAFLTGVRRSVARVQASAA